MRLISALWLGLRMFRRGKRGKRSPSPLLGTPIGIAISLVPLILVIYVADGMIQSITNRFIETSSYHLQLSATRELGDPAPLQDVAENLEKEPSILQSFVENAGFGLIYSPSKKMGALLRGLDPRIYEKDPNFARFVTMEQGSFDLNSPHSLLIGAPLARVLGVGVGDQVKILTAKKLKGKRFLPRVSRFTVKGVFTVGYDDLDRLWTFLPLATALEIQDPANSRSFIGVKTASPYGDFSQERREIAKVLGDTFPWTLQTWRTIGRYQQANYAATKLLLIWIMSLIVLVALINISSALRLFALSQSQETAILKCQGASPEWITASYLAVGGIAGTVGALLGIAVGSLLALSINQIIQGIQALINAFLWLAELLSGRALPPFRIFDEKLYLEVIPVILTPGPLVVIFLATVCLSCLFSYLPARKTGKSKPLDLMRSY